MTKITKPTQAVPESTVGYYHGQTLDRSTVLDGSHVTTLSAALAGIHAVVDVLHDREAQRAADDGNHCPNRNMGLLAAVHGLTTLVQLHISEDAGDKPAFVRDSQGLKELSSVTFANELRRNVKAGDVARWAQEQQAQHHRNLQPGQAETHAHQAQAATKTVAPKRSK